MAGVALQLNIHITLTKVSIYHKIDKLNKCQEIRNTIML